MPKRSAVRHAYVYSGRGRTPGQVAILGLPARDDEIADRMLAEGRYRISHGEMAVAGERHRTARVQRITYGCDRRQGRIDGRDAI